MTGLTRGDACPACAAARAHALSGAYRAGCFECRARFLAASPAYAESARAAAVTPRYRDALAASFGPEWREGHDAVKRWADAAMKERSA